MKILLRLISTSLLSIFFSCSQYKEVSVTSVDNFKVKKIDKEGVEVEIELGVYNPNNIGFKIYRSKFTTSFSGINLGETILRKRVKIAANSTAKYNFTLKYNLKKFDPNDLLGIFNGKAGLLEINGNVIAGKFFYRKKYPINFSEKNPLFGKGSPITF